MEPHASDRRTLIAIWLQAAYRQRAADRELVVDAYRRQAADGQPELRDLDPGSHVDGLRALLDKVEEAGDWALAANVRATLGREAARRDPAQAADLLASVAAEASAVTPTAVNSAWVAMNRGWACLAASDRESAESWFARSLDLGRHARHASAVSHAAAALAAVMATRGEREVVLALAREAIDEARALDLSLVLVMALTRAAEADVLLGRPAGAAERLSESLRILRDVGTLGWLADNLELAAVLAAHFGMSTTAARLLGAAGAVDAVTGDAGRTPAPGADLAAVRAHRDLGEASFETERATGAALATDEALGVASKMVTAVGAPSGEA